MGDRGPSTTRHPLLWGLAGLLVTLACVRAGDALATALLGPLNLTVGGAPPASWWAAVTRAFGQWLAAPPLAPLMAPVRLALFAAWALSLLGLAAVLGQWLSGGED